MSRVDNRRYAAVNIVLRDISGKRELLFIKRRINPFDPWSGDVGFPGGGLELSEDYIEAALRETEEEVGIKRQYLDVVGVLGVEHTLIIPWLKIGVVVSKLKVVNPEINPSWNEVEEVFWAPINDIIGPVRLFHSFKGVVVNAYIVKNRYIVWGFTKRILDKYLNVIRRI